MQSRLTLLVALSIVSTFSRSETIIHNVSLGPTSLALDHSGTWKETLSIRFPKSVAPREMQLFRAILNVDSISQAEYSVKNLSSANEKHVWFRLNGTIRATGPIGDMGSRRPALTGYKILPPLGSFLNVDMGWVQPLAWHQGFAIPAHLSMFEGKGLIECQAEFSGALEWLGSSNPSMLDLSVTLRHTLKGRLAYVYISKRNVTCAVTFSDILWPNKVPPTATIVFTPLTQGLTGATFEVAPTSFGVYTADAPGKGLYSVSVKIGTWLRKTMVVDTSNGARVQQFRLINGDCDGNNVIDLQDFFILSDSYGLSATDPGYDPRADLNTDQVVDLLDYFILSNNYLVEGDPL